MDTSSQAVETLLEEQSSLLTSEEGLDRFLKFAVDSHGYDKVRDHLQRIGPAAAATVPHKRISARALLRLPMGERDRLLVASVEAALPDYEADRALPPDERVLTADLETGDGLGEEDASA